MHRRFVLIGNGSIDPMVRSQVDPSDQIIRFNDCRNFDSLPVRTDVVAVCNTGRPARNMVAGTAWRRHPAVEKAREIWSVRPNRLFTADRARIIRDYPELLDLCDDYTQDFAEFCGMTGKQHRIIGEEIHAAVAESLLDYQPSRYVTPSSGLLVIEHVLRHFPENAACLVGFDHSGWSGHPFAAERALINAYVESGLLRRL